MVTVCSPVLLFSSQDEMSKNIELSFLRDRVYVAQAGLQLTIILIGLLECWDSRHVPPCLVLECFGFIFEEPSSRCPYPHCSHFIGFVILVSESRWFCGDGYYSSKCLQRNYIEENSNESKPRNKSTVATR